MKKTKKPEQYERLGFGEFGEYANEFWNQCDTIPDIRKYVNKRRKEEKSSNPKSGSKKIVKQ